METTQCVLLTRAEIVDILEKRELVLSDVDMLSYEDLLKIYKSFALPLIQRVPKYRQQQLSFSDKGQKMDIDETVSDNRKSKYGRRLVRKIDESVLQNLERRFNKSCFESDKPLTDEYLSCVTKRIRINSPELPKSEF